MPILALTAHALSGERDRVLMAGMDDYLTKPVPARALETTLARWIERRRPSDGAASELGDVSAPLHELLSLPPANAQAQVSTRPEDEMNAELSDAYLLDPEERRSEKVIELFLRLVPGQIESLLAVVHAGSLDELRLCSHKLKGSCASLGARALADLCLAIQQGAEQGDASRAEALAQRVAQLFVPTAKLLEIERAQKSEAHSVS
jgi:CheY-like chemotaxis protein